jgi:serine/threonine protein kinase
VNPQPGDLLANRYRVRKLLGTGSFGLVLLVDDERLDREVALKLMHPVEGGVTPRLWREARAAADIRHPHLVPVLDMGEAEGGRPFLVFELVSGGDLASWIDEHGPATRKQVDGWARGLAAALAELHDQGALHRDVKPANVLLHADGRAMLADLGLARVAGQETLTSTGMVLGTLAYLAPEVLEGGEAGPEADLYALGCTAFEARTGGESWRRDPPRDLSEATALGPPWLPELLAPVPAARLQGRARLLGEVADQPEKPPPALPRVLARRVAFAAVASVALVLAARALRSPVAPPPTAPAVEVGAGPRAWLGLTELVARMPTLRPTPETWVARLAQFDDPALALRTQRYLDALAAIEPDQAASAPEEWGRDGLIYLTRLLDEVRGIQNGLGSYLLDPNQPGLPSQAAIETFRVFQKEFDGQVRRVAAQARRGPHWGRAPRLDRVHSALARRLGWRLDPPLVESLIRGVETAPVGLELELAIAELVNASLQAQGEDGAAPGDTARRMHSVAALLGRLRQDLRGKVPGGDFEEVVSWPLPTYLDATFVVRQAVVVSAALEGVPLPPVPQELEGHFRILLARDPGPKHWTVIPFARHLERWLWTQALSLPKEATSSAARLVRQRREALHRWLDGDVYGIRWVR